MSAEYLPREYQNRTFLGISHLSQNAGINRPVLISGVSAFGQANDPFMSRAEILVRTVGDAWAHGLFGLSTTYSLKAPLPDDAFLSCKQNTKTMLHSITWLRFCGLLFLRLVIYYRRISKAPGAPTKKLENDVK